MFYADFFRLLEEANVRYLIVGGVAMLLHGFGRATFDLDLLISLDQNNVDRFLKLLKENGYRPGIPVSLEDFADPDRRKRWKIDKNMTVFSVHHPKRPAELIDIFIEEPIPFETAYAKRLECPVGSGFASVIGMDDLKSLKKLSARPQDLADIQALEGHLRKKES
jgi:hypothetical protein